MSRDHRKLAAFKCAHELVMEVYRASTNFPPAERHALQSQLRRAAVSVSTNIVEGCGRESEADFLRFLDIAFASCRELIYLLQLSSELAFMNEDSASQLATQASRVAAMLNNLRLSLRR